MRPHGSEDIPRRGRGNTLSGADRVKSFLVLPARRTTKKAGWIPHPPALTLGLNRLPGMFAWGLLKSLPYPKSRTSTERPY